MANNNYWNSTLESLGVDGINSESIPVQVRVGLTEENAITELDKEDIVIIGNYKFPAEDIVKLAATVEHITNVY